MKIVQSHVKHAIREHAFTVSITMLHVQFHDFTTDQLWSKLLWEPTKRTKYKTNLKTLNSKL